MTDEIFGPILPVLEYDGLSEVIDSVNKIIRMRYAPAGGDRATAAVVANANLVRRELDWVPKYANLDRIVADALGWEEILNRRNRH